MIYHIGCFHIGGGGGGGYGNLNANYYFGLGFGVGIGEASVEGVGTRPSGDHIKV